MPKLTGIDAELAYQLSQKKETVKYYSKIVSLLWASIPLVTKLWEKKETEQPGELLLQQTAKKVINWTVWVLILVLVVITYFAGYYTVSSIFWPEPLSIVNCLLLVPCGIYTGTDIWDRGKMVLGGNEFLEIMTGRNRYNAQSLEESFKEVAKARIRDKKRGKYTGDAGYWEGGRCEYGGAHNLQEDCRTLASLFDKLTNLKEAKQKLTNFTNEEQFNSTKRGLTNECEQITSNLNQQTQYSYIAGVCIIWGDFKSHVDSLKAGFTSTVEMLKKDIERTAYNEAKELKALEVEESQIKQEIENNERKANSESDPTKKARFLLLADEAKTKWKKLLERKKKIKLSNLGNDFNPDKFIEEFIQGVKDKIDGKPPKNRQNPNNFNSNSTGNSDGTSKPRTSFNSFQPNTNQNPNSNWLQENKQLLILAGVFLIIILYLYTQKQEAEISNNLYNYDYY